MSEELDGALRELVEAERAAGPVRQWMLPPRPADYAAGQRLADADALAEWYAEMDRMCESDR